MKSLPEICLHLSLGQFDFSRHAFKRAVVRNISDPEIRQAGENGTIIEDYPDDKYSPSCLLLGFTTQGKVIHLVVSRAEIDYVKIITVYEPDEDLFNGFEIRR